MRRLLFLVGFARNPAGWRDDTVPMGTGEELLPAVAHALWRQAGRALRGGLLQGYRTVEETSYVLRGRLREADQLRRHHGRPIPLEIRHDDFTTDVAENQILLAAITRMLAVPGVDTESRRRLAALRVPLADVTAPVQGTELPAWRATRLNQRYHSALRLAEIIWRATSPEHTAGTVASSGFLFDLPTVFEDFVTTAVTEALRTRRVGGARRQYRTHLDDARAVRIRPDLVWTRDGSPVAVLDAKYKQEKPAGYPEVDLYQMLAYCTALRLPRGHLVYARGNADPARHVVRGSGVEIVCHALDLDLDPSDLLDQIASLAEALVHADLVAASAVAPPGMRGTAGF